MPNPADYPLDFRPAGYRGGIPEMLARINGVNRRHAVEEAIRAGRLAEVPEALLAERAPMGYQRVAELIDFRNMGGEYLPGLRPNEVEVARVEMPTTTTGDVVSIRAREVKGGYRFVVLDEYETDYPHAPYRCSPGRSRRPLSLGQLIHLIDTAYRDVDEPEDYTGIFYQWWTGGTPDCELYEYRHFYRVTSPFYPDLERWYDELAAEWVAETQEIRGEPGRWGTHAPLRRLYRQSNKRDRTKHGEWVVY